MDLKSEGWSNVVALAVDTLLNWRQFSKELELLKDLKNKIYSKQMKIEP